METVSSFQFKGYKVIRSLIEIKDGNSGELSLEFDPKGVLDKSTKNFTLEMNVKIFDEIKNINIEVSLEGKFSFKEFDDNLNSFLLTNAPALIFPYIRAYITALTSLSGISPITLPTMNLSSLKAKLERNITEI